MKLKTESYIKEICFLVLAVYYKIYNKFALKSKIKLTLYYNWRISAFAVK